MAIIIEKAQNEILEFNFIFKHRLSSDIKSLQKAVTDI